MMFASSAAYFSGWAAGRSILLRTGNQVQVGAEGQVEVGEGLRLDALRRVDEQDRAFAGRQRPGHLVGEVHVTGRVDQVEHVLNAVFTAPGQPDRLALDRDAALALDVHPVQVLGPHRAVVDHAGELEHPVGQRGLAVINVGDDAEIADDRLRSPARLGRGQLLDLLFGRCWHRASSRGS